MPVSASAIDACSLGIAALIFAGTAGLCAVNGPTRAKGFVENAILEIDTNYLFGFIEQARLNHTYPSENPCLAGTESRYPALVHCGMAALADQSTGPAAFSLWWLFPFLTMSSALVVHGFWEKKPGIGRKDTAIMCACLAAFFISLRPDLVLYLQTQCIVLPFFMFLYFVLGVTRWKGCRMIPALALVLALIGMHAVLGLAAILFFAAHAWAKKESWWNSRRERAAMIVALVFFCGLYALLNHQQAPSAYSTRMQPSAWQLLVTIGYSYFVPLGMAASVCLYSWPSRPWRIAGLILLGLGTVYMASGLFCREPWQSVFAIFNAPRFFLLAWVAVAPAFLRLPRVPALLLLFSPLAIAPSSRNILKAWRENPRNDSKIVPACAFIRGHVPPNVFCIDSGVAGSLLPALSGHAALVSSPKNYFGSNMITEEHWRKLMRKYDTIFHPETATVVREEVLDSLDIGCVLAEEGTSLTLNAGWLPAKSWERTFTKRGISVWTRKGTRE